MSLSTLPSHGHLILLSDLKLACGGGLVELLVVGVYFLILSVSGSGRLRPRRRIINMVLIP